MHLEKTKLISRDNEGFWLIERTLLDSVEKPLKNLPLKLGIDLNGEKLCYWFDEIGMII